MRLSVGRDSVGSADFPGDKCIFYNHKNKVTTGPQIIAVVLMQFDGLTQNSHQHPDSGGGDAVIISLKDWTSPVLKLSAVESVCTNTRTKVDMPKPSQHESAQALGIVSSTGLNRFG